MSQRLEKGYLLGGQANLLYPVKEVFALLQTKRTIFLTGLDQRLPGLTVNEKFSFTVKNVNSYQNSFDFLIKDLTRWKKKAIVSSFSPPPEPGQAVWPAISAIMIFMPTAWICPEQKKKAQYLKQKKAQHLKQKQPAHLLIKKPPTRSAPVKSLSPMETSTAVLNTPC